MAGPDVVPNQWYHLVGTYDPETKTKAFYVDGQRVGAAGDVTVNVNEAKPLRIGAGQTDSVIGNFFWNGGVDEVAVFPSVLSQDRIVAHYTAAVGGAPALVNPPAVTYNPPATLSLNNVYHTAAGSYRVVVRNGAGTVTSDPVLLTVMPTPSYANLTNDLVLHLTWDGDLQDSSGRGNHGSAVGSPSFVPGRIGAQALRFRTDPASGTYDYVTLGAIGDLNNNALGYVLNVGQDGTGGYSPVIPDGTLDDLGIWRRALSTYEAQSIYLVGRDAGRSFDEVGPVRLEVHAVDGFVDVVWQGGTLVQSATVDGVYTAVPGAQAPFHRVTPAGAAQFYKVQ